MRLPALLLSLMNWGKKAFFSYGPPVMVIRLSFETDTLGQVHENKVYSWYLPWRWYVGEMNVVGTNCAKAGQNLCEGCDDEVLIVSESKPWIGISTLLDWMWLRRSRFNPTTIWQTRDKLEYMDVSLKFGIFPSGHYIHVVTVVLWTDFQAQGTKRNIWIMIIPLIPQNPILVEWLNSKLGGF